jgi:hypothetical protein
MRRTTVPRRPRLIAALVTATVALAAASGVAYATTGPAPHVLVNVTITNSAVTLSKHQIADITYVDFYLHNNSNQSHTLVIGIQHSVVVKPGGRVHFFVGFPVYGWYPYHVGLNGKPQQKGRFHIDSPQPPD